tara:strand:- start:636 stop:956 length:321 start_codon:yes stop_codon:yes gene_type:complete
MTDIQNTEKDVVVPYEMVRERQEKKPVPAIARLRQGKTIICGGTIIAMIGIVLYCTTVFMSEGQDGPIRFITEGLVTIGVGFSVWLYGVVKYLNAALELGYDDDSI